MGQGGGFWIRFASGAACGDTGSVEYLDVEWNTLGTERPRWGFLLL